MTPNQTEWARLVIAAAVPLLLASVAASYFLGELSGRVKSIESLEPHNKAKELIERAGALLNETKLEIAEFKKSSRKLPVIKFTRTQYNRNSNKTDSIEKIISRDADICYLTRIGGSFAGTGELVYVYRKEDVWNVGWKNGQPNPRGIKFGVNCVTFKIVHEK